MHDIRLKRAPHKDYRVQIPSSWQEISPRLYRHIFNALHGRYPAPSYRVRLQLVRRLLFFSRNPITQLRLWFWLKAMPGLIIYEISEKINFLWQKPSATAWLPSFRHGLTRYHLPESGLANATFIEYIQADALLNAIAAYPPHKLHQCPELDLLVATLCRPAKAFWWWKKRQPGQADDIREKFDQAIAKRRAKRLSKLPMAYKQYVLSYFLGCKLAIVHNPAYKFVFPRKRSSGNEGESGSLASLLYDLSKQPIYGNYEQTAFQNLHTVLYNLNEDIRRQKEALAKQKK
jgi:hypothetical protein